MDPIKILYIEDEPFLGKVVKESLESRRFKVTMLTDGAGALEVFRSFQPDICILDVMLPTKDGYTVGQEIKADNALMPIIYLTAKTQTDDVIKGFKSGGNDYIRKPFSMEELIIRVHNLLGLSAKQGKFEAAQSSVIKLGEYTFDYRKYQLIYQKEVKKLSHRETELLRILCEKQNNTVERKDILKSIWGDDSFFNSRNLDVYVTKLRSYLKADPNVRIITLKGVGYQFVVD